MKKNPWSWVPTLYFAEGIPYVVVMTVSLILFKQMGLNNTQITFYTSWLYLPWVIKPLWSPFIDLVKTKRWWILAMQLLLGAALGGVALTIPTGWWLKGSLCFFWLLAFSSATHDIAADGFYMLGLNQKQQASFVGIRSTFYRIATIFGQGLLVMFAGFLQERQVNVPLSWTLTFMGVAGFFIAIWLWHSFILPKPAEDVTRNVRSVSDITHGLAHTFATFFTKFPVKETLFGILFMLFYRMPEGLLAKISALFLIDDLQNGGLALTTKQYGLIQGTIGIIGLTIGGILGGWAVARHGLKKWIWPMVCAITLPDIVYVYPELCPDVELRRHQHVRVCGTVWLRLWLHGLHALPHPVQPGGLQDQPLRALHGFRWRSP